MVQRKQVILFAWLVGWFKGEFKWAFYHLKIFFSDNSSINRFRMK